MKETMMMDNARPCANTRANICDTAKGNRVMLVDLRSMLDNLANVLECGPVTPCNEAVNAEPNCLLDEVLLHKAMLEDMHCTIKRIYVSLQG